MNKLALPILLVSIAIFSFFWYTQPAWDDMQAVRSDIDEHETALTRVSEIQQLRDQLLSSYNSLPDSNLYILRSIVPDEVKPVRFLIELNQIAVLHGLTVREPSFSRRAQAIAQGSRRSDEAPAPEKPYATTVVNFRTSGAYEDVLSFVRDMERSARMMDITELSVSSAPPEDQQRGGQEPPPFPSGDQNTYEFTANIYSINALEQ